MKTIYKALIKRLETVPTIRWVDFDFSQLDRKDERAPVAFPCVLLSIAIPRCRDLTETVQTCEAHITLRIAFDPLAAGRTAANAPDAVRDEALNPLRRDQRRLRRLAGI